MCVFDGWYAIELAIPLSRRLGLWWLVVRFDPGASMSRFAKRLAVRWAIVRTPGPFQTFDRLFVRFIWAAFYRCFGESVVDGGQSGFDSCLIACSRSIDEGSRT